MKVQIGMQIWKEMKRQGLSQRNFFKILREKNVFMRDLFLMETIDVNSLVQISAVLKTNFFQLYEAEELLTLMEAKNDGGKKVSALKEMIKTQSQLLLTQKQLIRQQDRLIEQLQKNEG